MPLKCQFCKQESVVEEDVGDGQEHLICVECGGVATLPASQLREPTASTCSSMFSLATTDQEAEDNCEAEICQSCGEDLQPGDSQFCSECLEQDQEETTDASQDNKFKLNEKDVNSQTGSSLDNKCKLNEKDVNRQTDDGQKGNVSCSSCGSLDIIVDELGTEEQTVCKSCGHVVGKQTFTTNESEVSSTRTFGNQMQTLPMFARRQGHCHGFTVGVEKISTVQQKLALSSHIKEEAVNMYERLFYSPVVVKRTLVKKEHIAVACVYVACRQDSLPVSMVHFQDFRDSVRLFTWALKLVTRLLDIKLLPPALGTQVRQIFQSINLGVENKHLGKMLAQVRDVVFLCRDAWLTSGRHTQPIIVLAIYYVYRNCDNCPRRLSLPKFCSQFKLPPVGHKMVSDFQKLCLHLASHLPWAKQGQVRRSTIHLFIPDILQYKKSLLHLAFEKPGVGQECSPWEAKPRAEPEPKPQVTDNTALPGHWIPQADLKKAILLPESFKRSREAEPVQRAPDPTIPAHLDLDCPEIKPTDFSEEEISSYILTSAEQGSLKEAKENLFREKKPRLK